MKIRFENIPSLLLSEEFRKDLREILKNVQHEKDFIDFLTPTLVYLSIAICADKKGHVKGSNKIALNFINSNIDYLKTLLFRIIPQDEIYGIWKNG